MSSGHCLTWMNHILKLWWELQFPNIYRVKKRMLIVL